MLPPVILLTVGSLPELKQALVNIRASQYMTAAGHVLLLYDHLLTLPEEVKLVWPTDWSLVKVLFLINRYVVPTFLTVNAWAMSGLSPLTPSDISFSCKVWIVLEAYAELISMGVAHVLLLLRVHALYGRTRKILVFLGILFVITQAAMLSTATVVLIPMSHDINYNHWAGKCITATKPKSLPGIWVAPLGFELVIFVMTLNKCLQHARSQEIHTPLLKTLYRDGFLYFLILLIIHTLNLVLWIIAPVSILYLGLYFLWSLITLLISRLFLNLRNVSSHSQWQAETDYRGPADIQFARRSDLTMQQNRTTILMTGYTGETGRRNALDGWVEEEEPRFQEEDKDKRAIQRTKEDVEAARYGIEMELVKRTNESCSSREIENGPTRMD